MVIRFFDSGFRGLGFQGGGMVGAYIREAEDIIHPPKSRQGNYLRPGKQILCYCQ